MRRNLPTSGLTRSRDVPESVHATRTRGHLATWGVGLAIMACALASLGFYGSDRLVRSTLALSKAERGMGRIRSARDRLAWLETIGLGRAEVRLELGRCELDLDAPDQALLAWERIPRSSPVWGEAAVARGRLLARSMGRFRAAETVFRDAAQAGGRAAIESRWSLAELLTWQGRIEEARGVLEAIWRTGQIVDRRAALRESWRLESMVVAPDEFSRFLDHADPNDDRVWLSHAWAERLKGEYVRAHDWLVRCQAKSKPDQAIWLAWLDWAVAAGSPQEAAWAIGKIHPDAISGARAVHLSAWLARARGDDKAEREHQLRRASLVPGDVGILDRLAVISTGASA